MAQDDIISLDYDKKADVLYGSFRFANEPSYCEDLDDFTLIELGMFTNQPTGFRIISPSKHDLRRSLGLIRDFLRKTGRELQQLQKQRQIVQRELREDRITALLAV